MTAANRKSGKTAKPEMEEEIEKSGTQEISLFIRKIELQSLVLKKISDNLDQQSAKDKRITKSDSQI